MTEEEKCPECGQMIEDGGCECYLDDEESLDSGILEDDDEPLKEEDEEVA